MFRWRKWCDPITPSCAPGSGAQGQPFACGTGACAVLVVGHQLGWLERRATIRMPGGELLIEWREDNQLLMTGSALQVFEGTLSGV
jgi:diaminopimelate epimerase